MSIDFDKELRDLLDAHLPQSLLVVSPEVSAALSDYQSAHPDCRIIRLDGQDVLSRLDGLGRFELGIIVNTLEHMDKASGARLIARLRDLHTARFYAMVPIGKQWRGLADAWEPADFIAYGMALAGSREQEGKPLHVYKFDISDYKKTPDWLNPSHWANPELWDKYRW